jgi:transposase
MEQRLRSIFALVQRWRLGSSLHRHEGRARLRIHHDRLHHRPRTSACGGQKRGPEARAIGRSRGGLTTKIHAVVDALGNPLRFILTPGQASDFTQAEALIDGLPAEYVLGDKGYDSKAFRDAIEAQNATPVIPPRKTSPQVDCDYALYCERNLVERFFLKIKHFRRIATRYEQTTRAFVSILHLVSAFLWTK